MPVSRSGSRTVGIFSWNSIDLRYINIFLTWTTLVRLVVEQWPDQLRWRGLEREILAEVGHPLLVVLHEVGIRCQTQELQESQPYLICLREIVVFWHPFVSKERHYWRWKFPVIFSKGYEGNVLLLEQDVWVPRLVPVFQVLPLEFFEREADESARKNSNVWMLIICDMDA